MQYRRFGRTELQIPVFSCGGMRYQQSWQDADPADLKAESQGNLDATIAAALRHGINHIETARGYGSSERQLGYFLPTLPREPMIIQTKVGPHEDGEGFLKTFNTSMERLQLDHVELLAIHGINNADLLAMTLRPGGCLEMARELQAQGRCRHVGFSTHAPTQVILDAIATDRFDYVNLHWYWADQANTPALDAAAAHDMGVFIISPSEKGGKLFAPPAKLCELTAPLTPIVFNALWCLANPHCHTLSIGAARPSDFDAQLEALPYLDRSAELLPPILQRLEAEAERVLGQEWVRGWNQGLPDTDQVAGTVNLYHVLRLYNLALAYDMVDYAKMRYGLFGNGGHWFHGNKVDQLDFAQLPAALTASPVADRIPQVLHAAHELFGGEERKRLSQSE